MVESVVKGIGAMETPPYFEGSISTVPGWMIEDMFLISAHPETRYFFSIVGEGFIPSKKIQ